MTGRKIVQINTTCGVGSTGKIAVAISELLTKRGIENYILYSCATNGYDKGIGCCSRREQKFQALKTHVFGNYGFQSQRETRRIIRELDRIAPDAVLLHNIHGHDCNLDMLFTYFREKKTKLFWTFHDCWAFTGYCTYFTYAQCDRWRSGCGMCPQRRQTSWFFDRSAELYQRKKALFSGLDLTVITPSQWLAELVKQSFLKDCPVKVIHNGIDLSVFQPSPGDFRDRYGIPKEKFLLLGVAFDWEIRKGLEVFVELSKRLDSERYQIVLVGTDDAVDKKLPRSILSIHRTRNQKELAEIYTAADLLLNPTREDNYPTVNMEAIACGTPVLTFQTGGSPEMIDEATGCAVACGDTEGFIGEIERISRERPYSREACLSRAVDFDAKKCFENYVELLEERV